MYDPADQRDPIADANTAIHTYIRSLPGGRIGPEHRAGYEQLVEDYFQAVRQRDEDPASEPEPLAA